VYPILKKDQEKREEGKRDESLLIEEFMIELSKRHCIDQASAIIQQSCPERMHTQPPIIPDHVFFFFLVFIF